MQHNFSGIDFAPWPYVKLLLESEVPSAKDVKRAIKDEFVFVAFKVASLMYWQHVLLFAVHFHFPFGYYQKQSQRHIQ